MHIYEGFVAWHVYDLCILHELPYAAVDEKEEDEYKHIRIHNQGKTHKER